MTFNDKFKFLMDITNTNNTTLAGAVGIDNSAVSLYRSGKIGRASCRERV